MYNLHKNPGKKRKERREGVPLSGVIKKLSTGKRPDIYIK